MTTPIQQKIRDKKRTAEQIADMVKSGDWINHGTTGGDSTVCTEAVAKRLGPGPGQLRDIEFWLYAMFYPHHELQEIDPLQKYHCLHDFFFFPWNRKARDTNNVSDWAQWGWAYGMWAHHYRFTHAQKEKRAMDWWFNAATAPDAHGYFNMSYGTNNANIFRQTAKKIVFEVRSDYPWAEGGRFNTIHLDEVDYWVEVDCEKYKWPQVNEKGIEPKPVEKEIAKHVMSIMRDRDVVQLGIGALPSACVSAMADAGFKDLGVHTEMLNYGLIKLIESGQVTNAYKPIDRGKSVYTFAFPVDVKWYYDTIHHNQAMAVYDIDYTNNLHNLTRIDNMIAINNAVAVDLLGQICTGFYEKRPISSSGGFFQFVSFCAQSRGGRGVASMTSRSKHQTSRIVPFLPEGSTVDVPAQLANYVCTEYGIVNLRGLSGYERASALISIAHPDDREWLEQEARKHGLLAPNFPVSMLNNRRYPAYEERRKYKIPMHSSIWGYDWEDGYQSGK
ncbi:MAG: hypothetical protein K9K75_03170 [Deltaproteobacteria bacterium]|nr:hypothetical protein [Deltaproteobacteria bacterium]